MEWTTRVPDAFLQRHGVAELHTVFLQHKTDKAGPSHCVTFLIPEVSPSDVVSGLLDAERLHARIMFACDTAQQAELCIEIAATVLSDYRRVSFERAMEGGWSLSS